jgi:uncharacterized protein
LKSRQNLVIVSIVISLLIHNLLVGQNKGDDIVIGKYDKLSSKILNEERTLLISVPPGYESSKEKYPVLYLLDGDVLPIAESYYLLNNFEQLFPRMIVVAIKNTNRNRDMLPSQRSEGAKKFLKFISEELFPYIKKNYRADNFRILFGASNAGVFVLYSLLESPNAFSGYISSSPTVIWRYDYLVNKVKEVAASKLVLNRFLYIIYGDKEWPEMRDTLKKYIPLLEELKTKDLKLKTIYLPDESHVPAASLSNGLKYIFEGYQYPEENASNGNLDSLKMYYDRFSKKLNYRIKIPGYAFTTLGDQLLNKEKFKEAIEVYEESAKIYPEIIINVVQLAIAYYRDQNKYMSIKYCNVLKKAHPEYANYFERQINDLGYRLIALKNNDEALEAFKFNVEVFPDSWNAFDSLAEAYMKVNNKKLAIENYEKSLKINPNNNNAKEQIKKIKENK